jgi:hypothetical protein
MNFSDIETYILSILKDLKNDVNISKIDLFNGFIVNDVKSNVLPKAENNKASKYEARFFWPSHIYPEVYDFSGLIFNKKNYTNKLTKDKYIVADNNLNIKIRKNDLHVKAQVHQIGNIYQFKKKKKISFPLKGKKINSLLNQKISLDSDMLETPEDLIMKLSNFPGISCIEVIKERYVRAMEDHTKIEFSLIKIQEKQWKTICIESKNIQKVLALSFLINQEKAEKLSYSEFLRKYG